MAKIIGTTTIPTIGGVDFECSKFTVKLEQKKIEYEYLGGQWTKTIPGGVMKASGSFEMAADSTHLGSTYPAPFSITTVAFSSPLGSAGFSFNAVVEDVEIDYSTELVTVKGNYQSDGQVTFG